jgi:seryl-tRNA synthetase
VLALDDTRKAMQLQLDTIKNQQKKLGEEKKYDEAKALKVEIQALEEKYQSTVKELDQLLLKMPNTAIHPDVPVGKDESENVVTKTI